MHKLSARITAVLLAAVMALSACGGGDNDPAPEPPSDPVADLATKNLSGPVGAVSRANDVAGQLDQRNADLDALP